MLATELGKALGDAILHFCSISEIDRFKKEFDLEEMENAEQDYFYLLMFLITYACQIAFINNQNFSHVILDSLHKYMAENRLKVPLKIPEDQELQEKLRKRYAQYYELSRTKERSIDVSFLTSQLPYDFFANVLKNVDYIFNDTTFKERWGKVTVPKIVGKFLGQSLAGFSLTLDLSDHPPQITYAIIAP
jgi:hypothetical protein